MISQYRGSLSVVGLQLPERNVIGINAIILLFRGKANSHCETIVYKMSLVDAKNILYVLYERSDSLGLPYLNMTLWEMYC
ncbi:MAG TPA: hypothetical protein PLV62_10655 [Spirochaetota bacterium]|nr:hypothetical protein [Spirochaetota bacterium]HOT18762.1 hypothetical protein [Spirochaetota bacterium]HPD06204.1 hypothetical protein [Spirochaetota bacterium]HPK45429.1 hypothetical protein [Spirochaetota bacterium]HQG42337.1 hypothetical protein [Spirochaetota bacterium]